jgi:hypothetical protein
MKEIPHMKLPAIRPSLAALVAITAWLMLSGATEPRTSVLQPDKLLVLSTTDVKGKTSPCG